MQISLPVPYDPQLARRTLMFMTRRLFLYRFVRAGGAIIVVAGLLVAVLDPVDPVAYALIGCGLLFLFGIVPLNAAYAARLQPEVLRQDCHLVLDDESVHVAYPSAESRFRWAAVDRVVETPEVWYLMFGRVQAVTVPKAAMTPEQRAEFAAFVSGLRSAALRRAVADRRWT